VKCVSYPCWSFLGVYIRVFGTGQDSLQVLGVRLPLVPAADTFLVSSLGLYTCMFGAVVINLWLDSLS
jgi:hypothetical protein